MNYQTKMEQWLTDSYFDQSTKKEIKTITDETELKNRFEVDLDFGTGGLRGVMGAGTNRINQYTVRRASYGLALYLKEAFGAEAESRGVVIAYDSRTRSDEFALQTALVFCACNIKVYLFDTITSTPELSFAVAYLNCIAGVVITASHNPKEYNGYKAYDQYGCQFVPDDADKIIEKVNMIVDFATIPIIERIQAVEDGLLKYIGEDVHRSFYEAVLKQSLLTEKTAKEALSIVYTPLHGTGNKPVRKVLYQDGFTNVHVLKEQESPDGNFPTVKSPNPEDKAALDLAIQYAREIHADIIIGTDPDCDRVGIAVADKDKYNLLSGNQVGALLADYVLSEKQKRHLLADNAVMIKTIVTSQLGDKVADLYNVKTVDTLTGFKYIGELITRYETQGTYDFILGYEESYGYLIGKHARDKDAVVASMMICEMAAFHKANGRNLLQVLQDIYSKCGYYIDHLDSYTFDSVSGLEKITEIMKIFRNQTENVFPFEFTVKDYSAGIDGLPKADVLKFILQDGSWIAVRPSGTEPKIKFYYSMRGSDQSTAQQNLQKARTAIEKIIEL